MPENDVTLTARQSREQQFMQLVADNRQLICKVCYMYATDADHFNDLYQEVLANMWQGLSSFRGEASISTWIYRMAINTCVTFYRRNRRNDSRNVSLESILELPGEETSRADKLREMYRLISTLEPLEKALILMWLDERSYDEISQVTGMGRNNVASRLRRIKQKLVKKGQE